MICGRKESEVAVMQFTKMRTMLTVIIFASLRKVQ